jgi:hypothetical protein
MVVFCQKDMRGDDEGRRSGRVLRLIESGRPLAATTIDTCDLPVATLRGLHIPGCPTMPREES